MDTFQLTKSMLHILLVQPVSDSVKLIQKHYFMPTAFVRVHLDFKFVFICISFECKQIKYDTKIIQIYAQHLNLNS